LDALTSQRAIPESIPVNTIMPERAGHGPLEEPGFLQMIDAIDGFRLVKAVIPRAGSRMTGNGRSSQSRYYRD
jgi:hypothetical protein